MIYRFVEQERVNHSVRLMCRTLGVSPSGYYKWRTRGLSDRARRDAELTLRIKQIHQSSRGIYGAPRINAELKAEDGIYCSKKRVARLMNNEGLEGVSRRKKKGCTKRAPGRDAFPDLVNRNFTVNELDQLWVADITQHKTDEGWVYLANILDAFSRRVVGWSMGCRPVADMVVDAANMAIKRRQPQNVIHHSDHGSQYTSLAFSNRLCEAGIVGSMGSVGDALDNAVAESFFATLQTELLDRYTWSKSSELTTAMFEYIEVFYNQQRRHSALNYLSPAEFERRQQNNEKEAELALKS